MLSAETSALVAGGMRAPATATAPQVTVRVLRAVMVGGKRIDPGTELAVDRWFAAELLSAGKAERLADAAPHPPELKPAAKAAKEKHRAEQ